MTVKAVLPLISRRWDIEKDKKNGYKEKALSQGAKK